MTTIRRCAVLLTILAAGAAGQGNSPEEPVSPDQIAKLIGIDALISQCASTNCTHVDPQTVTV